MGNSFYPNFKFMTRFYLVSLALLAFACNNPLKSNNNSANATGFEKDVETHTNSKLYELPSELEEISGISFINNDVVLAIQDEEGILYQYDLKQRKITSEFKFGEEDDYEDLVRIGNDVYVVISNGTIIRIKDFQAKSPQVEKFKTSLGKKNDIEGICYDAPNSRLLLSDKESAKDDDKKNIYAFNLNTMTLADEPVYTIDIDIIETYFKGDALVETSKKFLKMLGNKNIDKVFVPSAITINPKNNHLYVLSAINKIIAELTPDGKIVNMISIEGQNHQQPEGIAFAGDGKLYVSNEAGKNGRANIIELEHAN